MKEDIIAANLSSLRADIQALPQKIAEELNQNATEQSDSSLQIDETKVASLISDAVSTALQSRLYFMMTRSMWTNSFQFSQNLPICIIRSQLTATKMQRL